MSRFDNGRGAFHKNESRQRASVNQNRMALQKSDFRRILAPRSSARILRRKVARCRVTTFYRIQSFSSFASASSRLTGVDRFPATGRRTDSFFCYRLEQACRCQVVRGNRLSGVEWFLATSARTWYEPSFASAASTPRGGFSRQPPNPVRFVFR